MSFLEEFFILFDDLWCQPFISPLNPLTYHSREIVVYTLCSHIDIHLFCELWEFFVSLQTSWYCFDSILSCYISIPPKYFHCEIVDLLCIHMHLFLVSVHCKTFLSIWEICGAYLLCLLLRNFGDELLDSGEEAVDSQAGILGEIIGSLKEVLFGRRQSIVSWVGWLVYHRLVIVLLNLLWLIIKQSRVGVVLCIGIKLIHLMPMYFHVNILAYSQCLFTSFL